MINWAIERARQRGAHLVQLATEPGAQFVLAVDGLCRPRPDRAGNQGAGTGEGVGDLCH